MNDSPKNFWGKLWARFEGLILHLLAMCGVVISIKAFEYFLTATLGQDAKLFDVIRIRDLAQIGDLVAIGRFIWSGVKEFKDV